MDHYCLSNHTIRAIPSAVKAVPFHRFSVPNSQLSRRILRRGASIVSAGPSHCESSSLNTPLEPRSEAGKYLSRVLQNQRQEFHASVAQELKQLANDRDAAVSRMVLSVASDEASLHRRIAELKESDSKTTLQDVMYMLILFKFSEIKVNLVPKLSRCTYNGRLDILPSKDWELESIYTLSDALDMVRQHVYAVTGYTSSDSSITNHWPTTQLRKCQLGDIYASSIIYGYFLKSVSIRHSLEHTLSLSHLDRTRILHGGGSNSLKTCWPYGWNNLVFGQSSKIMKEAATVRGSRELSCYVNGFDSESLQRCAKVRSREAVGLIQKQTYALFGDGKGFDDVVLTSFSSLKRLVLEAVGFGSFLWDVEGYVDSVYKLTTD